MMEIGNSFYDTSTEHTFSHKTSILIIHNKKFSPNARLLINYYKCYTYTYYTHAVQYRMLKVRVYYYLLYCKSVDFPIELYFCKIIRNNGASIIDFIDFPWPRGPIVYVITCLIVTQKITEIPI